MKNHRIEKAFKGDQVMADLEYIKYIIHVDERIMKLLRELREIENTVRHLEKYLLCDPYTEECLYGNGEFTKRLEEWLRLYERISETEPDKIISYVLWEEYRKRIDYNELVLTEICRERGSFDCITVNVKLPLNKESKELILSKIREKIERIVNDLPMYYARTIMGIKEILEGIHHEIEELRKNYEMLRKRYQELLQKVISH